VCDAYSAMTSDRSYRLALTHREAIAELRRCAGTQFDPRVVRAVERCLTPRSSSRLRAGIRRRFSSRATATHSSAPERPPALTV
jgi:HD-GYP domain-containing protein (c-di-GMP phosphodiesterase class II)